MKLLNTYILIATTLLFTACSANSNKKSDREARSSSVAEKTTTEEKPAQIYRFTLFGHEVNCSEDGLCREFDKACSADAALSFDMENQNISICGVGFHLNPSTNGAVMLLSSVAAESRRIVPVRKLISRYYGEEQYEEPYHYYWAPGTKTNTSVRLRRVHSDEGGTVIFIN